MISISTKNSSTLSRILTSRGAICFLFSKMTRISLLKKRSKMKLNSWIKIITNRERWKKRIRKKKRISKDMKILFILENLRKKELEENKNIKPS